MRLAAGRSALTRFWNQRLSAEIRNPVRLLRCKSLPHARESVPRVSHYGLWEMRCGRRLALTLQGRYNSVTEMWRYASAGGIGATSEALQPRYNLGEASSHASYIVIRLCADCCADRPGICAGATCSTTDAHSR